MKDDDLRSGGNKVWQSAKRFGRKAGLGLTVSSILLGTGPLAYSATYNVATYSELYNAINSVNGGSGGDTINLTTNITLAGFLPTVTKDVTINGAGYTLSGNNTYRILSVTEGTTLLNNIWLVDGKSTGANGGNGYASSSSPSRTGGGGGGGAGFSLSSSNSTGGNASGTTGGSSSQGGGLGGNGSSPTDPLSAGGMGAFGAGGGGGGGGSPDSTEGGAPGSGGFGGGSGGKGGNGLNQRNSPFSTTRREGGGGGGGGSLGAGGAIFVGSSGSVVIESTRFSNNSAVGGNGGNGGNSDNGYGGGAGSGGAGYGGAIFVQSGGEFTISANFSSYTTNSVAGGAAGTAGTGTIAPGSTGSAGNSGGSILFLMGGSSYADAPIINISSNRLQFGNEFLAGGTNGATYFKKYGAGTLALTSNISSNNIQIEEGTLELNNSFGNIVTNSTLKLTHGASQASNYSISGAGSVVVASWSEVTLNGEKFHTGGTFIEDYSYLTVTNGLSGEVHNEGHLYASGTVSANISGGGSVDVTSSSTLTLTGENTYTGGTYVNGGRVIGTTTSLQGGIAPQNANSYVRISQDHDGEFSGYVIGFGVLEKYGQGKVKLSGQNTHSGGTLIAEGTLEGDSFNLGGNVNLQSATARLLFTESEDGTFAGNITGTGIFEKAGATTLTLTGSNSTAETIVTEGKLQVGNGGSTGSLTSSKVTNHGTLEFNRADNILYSGTIQGTGSVVKNGDGQLQLVAANSFLGGTTVKDGILLVSHAQALGSGIIQIDGGTLKLASGITLENEIRLDSGSYIQEIGAGVSLENKVNITSNSTGGISTEARLLAGETSGATELVTSFSLTSTAANDRSRISDVLNLEGTGSGLFVLQLSVASLNKDSFLAWRNPTGNLWVNATFGNDGNNATLAQIGFLGSFYQFQFGDGGDFLGYGANLSQYVGAWGIDLEDGSVWAVLNHNSEFAAVPEPSTGVFVVLFTAGAGWLSRRRKKSGSM